MEQLPDPNFQSVTRADTLDVKAVAQSLGVSKATVLRWIQARKIEGFFRIGHKWLIRKSDFNKFINNKIVEKINNQ